MNSRTTLRTVAAAAVLAAACATPALADGSDPILHVAKDGSRPGAVVLAWAGRGPQFEVFRDTLPELVATTAALASDVQSPWDDVAPPAVPLTCYLVESACLRSDVETCNGLDDNCDQEIDEGFNLQNDPANCGRCGLVCEAAQHATTGCSGGECVIVACETGWGDLNGDVSDGCEFPCETAGSDVPDDLFQDRDCDGVDGNASTAIFVAGDVGDDANPGTRPLPVQTIGQGIALAVQQGKDVYVSKGFYPESVTLASGVALIGAYDWADDWARAADHLTLISGDTRAVTADGVSGVLVDTFTIRSAAARDDGESSVGIFARASSNVVFSTVQVVAGDGAPGADGVAGSNGANGGDGASGLPGCERDSIFGIFCDDCPRPAGGAGGPSACDRRGGDGGQPGWGDGGGESGTSGVAGGIGGSGGIGGGVRCGSGGDGDAGGSGTNGSSAAAGAGGDDVGLLDAAGYVAELAGGGGDGDAGGAGGGGGGGGGGGDEPFNCGSFGSSGGGGGAGGCPGIGGGGAQGGGGSFAAYLFDSSVTFRRATLLAGNGGDGGAGGAAGAGGAGGAGGSPGPYGGSGEQDDASCGGPGGTGGSGGAGGQGGGGGGGPSIALFVGGTSTVNDSGSTTLVSSAPGAGGAAPSPGAMGRAAPRYP